MIMIVTAKTAHLLLQACRYLLDSDSMFTPTRQSSILGTSWIYSDAECTNLGHLLSQLCCRVPCVCIRV